MPAKLVRYQFDPLHQVAAHRIPAVQSIASLQHHKLQLCKLRQQDQSVANQDQFGRRFRNNNEYAANGGWTYSEQLSSAMSISQAYKLTANGQVLQFKLERRRFNNRSLHPSNLIVAKNTSKQLKPKFATNS
ncbi:MAG: hypothetical protein P3M75_00320 [Candidatus Hodgkinia cicadicola]|nr:MAG: hypothetical protein P3M75_00320 [Candidatus Hodgkinia cicadicola]